MDQNIIVANLTIDEVDARIIALKEKLFEAAGEEQPLITMTALFDLGFHFMTTLKSMNYIDYNYVKGEAEFLIKRSNEFLATCEKFEDLGKKRSIN